MTKGTGKFDISYSGYSEMGDLKENLETTNSELKDITSNMQNRIGQLGPSIGIFEDQLNALVNDVKSAQSRGEEGIDLLSNKLGQLREKVKEMCDSGLAQW